MLSDLRQVMIRSVARPSATLDTAAVMRRGRVLRRRRKVMAASVAGMVGVAVWALAAQLPAERVAGNRTDPVAPGLGSGEPASSARNGYSFSSVDVGEGSTKGKAKITFSVAWLTEEFPGFRRCTFTAFDSSGHIVGQDASKLASTNPEAGAVRREIAVDAAPASADIECGARLDDPDGSYEISNVRVEEPEVDGYRELLVYFDARWTGAGEVHGVSECSFIVYDGAGEMLLEEIGSFSTEHDLARDIPYPLAVPPDFGERNPTSASVECRPFTGD